MGAISRQLAQRVVDRFQRAALVEAKPVFLVAMGEGTEATTGVLVFGSAPEPKLAAEYARGSGASHALVGAVEQGTLRASLVSAADARELATFSVALEDASLPFAEGTLATAVARALNLPITEENAGRLGAPLTASADAYRAFLVAMDFEMTASVLRRNRPDEAERATRSAAARYLDALRGDPSFELAEERFLYLVAERLERGETDGAIELLEDLIAVAPRAWRAHYMLGDLRAQSGLEAQAVVAFEHADALRPLSDADQVRLARLYLATNAPDAAAARLRRIGTGSAQYAYAQEELGLVALARADAPSAIAAFERAKAAGGRGPVLFARLGQTYASVGDLAAARSVFEQGLTAPERSWQLLAAYATFLHGERDLSRAIALYREAIAAGAPAPARLNLARALVIAGLREEARDELEAVIRNGADPDTLANARRLRFGVEHPEDEARLEEAGQIAVGARPGDSATARETLAEIAERNPELWEAHFGLGLAERRLGDATAAERSLRRALDLWPAQPDALHELGVALLMQGKLDESVHLLESAAGERPADAGYVADAGFARMVAGDLFTARSRLERAQRLDPDDEIIKSYVAELERRETETR